MELTVAIPTYNNLRQLADCIGTLTRYVEYPMKVVVINNGEVEDRDGLDFEEELRRRVEFKNLVVDRGEWGDASPGHWQWQAGINHAFEKHCDTPLFCMMNDDLVFIPYHRSFFRQLASYFRYTEVGAVGPSTNFVMGTQSIFRHDVPLAYATTLLIGFCMMVRSEAFSKVGGLDETLPGGDDLDLSILLRQEGYELLVDRSCYVHHIGCQTGMRVREDWNSYEMTEITNNALIKKHGVREWYDCVQARVKQFEPVIQKGDAEGDLIRGLVAGLESGLDIGCGHNKTRQDAVGVDKDPKGSVGNSGGRKGTVSEADLVADASNIPLEEGSQDYLICRHVFEHLVDPFLALKEWRRLLKPGGKLIIACPDEDRCYSMILDFTHKHAYTRASLTKILHASGFVVESEHLVDPGFSFVLEAVKPIGGNTIMVDTDEFIHWETVQ